jgi:predicted outer membrane repeat protein
MERKNLMKSLSIKKTVQKFLRLIIMPILLSNIFGFHVAGVAHAIGGTTLYVQPSGLTSGTCNSWANACDLQYALGLAVSDDEIWAAFGTYYPTTGTDRTASFNLVNGVGIYGGFSGTETLLTDRDPVTNVTILSGDIGTPSDTSDNSYHVVTGNGTSSSAVLDGFTITDGNADEFGAGMYNDNSSPTLSNLTFIGNTAPVYGGGMYNDNSSPTLSNLNFIGNTVQAYGGGMFNNNSNPILTNVTFSGNSATRGGAMYSFNSSSPTLMDVTFIGNSAATYGGAMAGSNASPYLTNVTFSGNSASYGAGISNSFGGNPILSNVTFSNNSASTSGGGLYNYDSNPTLTNVIIANSTSGGDCVNDGSSTLNAASSHNLIEDAVNACGLTNSVNGNIIGSDPQLDTLTDFGGPGKAVYPLLPGSNAIDAGDEVTCPLTDQRGVSRPKGTVCDIGAYESDTDAPELISFTRQTPGTSPTNANSLIFRATFDEAVKNANAADFAVNGTTSATVTNVTVVDAHIYDVTVSGGDLASFNGEVGINLDGSQNIQDLSGNDLPTGEPGTDETYVLDNIPPSVSSIVRAGSDPSGAASVDFTVTFSESVTGVNTADFVATPGGDVTGALVTNVSGSGTTYTVTVGTGTGDGTIRLDVVDNDSIKDGSNNPLGGTGAGNGNFTTGQEYTIIKGALNPDQTSIDFGEQLYYTKSDAITTTLTNDQSIDIHLGSFLRSSGQFILLNNTCAGATLTPAQTCTFDMQFKPTAYGALPGTLTINSDAANDPVVISLAGVGLPGTQLVTKGGSFEQDNDNNGIPDFWNTTGLTSLDGQSNQYAKHGIYSMKIAGQSGVTKTLKQTIVQNGSAGDDFLYVLWSRAQSVPGGFKYRTQVSFYNGTTLVERRIKDYTSGTHDWEYRWLPITVLGDYTRIEVEIIYSLASGTVWFDSDSLKWAP